MRRILVVDDESLVLDTLSQLVRHLGHQPLPATTGALALRLFKEDMPHAAILDMKLPDMPGIEVLRTIRARDPQFPVIIVTGAGTEALEEEARQLGVKYFLQKAFSLHALKEALDHILPQLNGAQGEPGGSARKP